MRTPLPADSALSVHIGVKAAWQSASNYSLRKRIREIGADVSAYALNETPTLDNLTSHQLTLSALPKEPDWYTFEPATDKVRLIVDIVDAKKRLGKIVLSDLRTGRSLGTMAASADGSSLRGFFRISWEQPFCRIEGCDTANAPLFRLGVSHGQPDTFVHAVVEGEFAPYRPPSVSSARFIESDPGKGPMGSPFEFRGLTISAHPGDGFSLGYCAADQKNDDWAAHPLQAPGSYYFYKKACIEHFDGAAGYPMNAQMDQPGITEDVRLAEQEDHARGVVDLMQPPYSDCTGHWRVRFVGKATAFLLIPYTVAKQKGLLPRLKSLLGTLSKRMPDSRISTLAFGVEEAFAIWVQSDAGRHSGFTRGMVKALRDIKTVETQADRSEFAVAQGLFENVTFTLLPDILPLSGRGSVTIKKVGFWTPISPPDTAGGDIRTLTIAFPACTGTLKLQKGYQWEVLGKLLPPGLYEPLCQPIDVRTPAMYAVKIPMMLSALRELKIYTVNAAKPEEAIHTDVQVLNAANQVVARGVSTSQPDGRSAFSAMFLMPGIYTIKVGPGTGRQKWGGSGVMTVNRGRLLEMAVGAAPSPP